MIHPETRLKSLFATLPKLAYKGKEYDVHFDFGTQKDLYKYLNLKRKQVTQTGKGNIYPIVWLETPIFPKGSETKVDFKLDLVIAVLTTSEMSNSQRVEDSFKLQIVPVHDNIVTALKKSGFTQLVRQRSRSSDDFFSYGRHFNYGKDNDTAHATTDIWDALEMSTDLIMTDQCQRQLNY